ncbi:Ig-like domain-containing protein [Arthrobacter sp. 260]|uniref:L,D-transpeptidase n=1 Tax=Arthrobacter sp. 260 TaxID=2735314 RepID=UPI001492E2E7|nr:Ig-like domain-containing protein [Arthrobacter sp. 260]NOJ60792.1 L,D-transpeptidase family protein [Arthrobacter sp. 260]
MMDKQQGTGKSRKGWVIGGVSVAALLIAAAAAVAVAPNWAGTGNDRPAATSTTTAAAPSPSPTTASSSPEPSVAADLAFNALPADGAEQVNPVTAPEIRAENGVIESVTLRAAGAEPVAGTLSENDTVWTATDRLEFATAYEFEFVLADANGNTVTESQSFSTVMPANEADAAMYPRDGSTVGTGQPIEINFSEPVINRDAVESAITITSTSGQTGAFYWLSDTKVRYRAEEFWAPNSTITVDMELFGVDYGNEMIGNFDDQLVFNTHNTRLAVVDNETKMMNVYIDGNLTETFPITLGTEEWPSTIGFHVVMEQYESTRFTAESIGLEPGDEAYYEPTVVNHASRISNGGAFVHEALPAAQVALGNFNVSHGCIGMSPEGAKYFYDTFGPGDVVEVRNTGYGPMFIWDGFGDWNTPWSEYSSQP